MDKDTIYASEKSTVDLFQFDDQVANVFPDMISRSVPGYNAIIAMIGDITKRFSQSHSYCYDLGCSLGAASKVMSEHITRDHCEIIAIDNSPAMIERCQGYNIPKTTFICSDILEVSLSPASIVVLNFTLQFIPLDLRDQLLMKISKALLPGGVLILSEKICFDNPDYQELMTELHHQFKRDNGYSDLEIAQKRTALEKVLIPESVATHKNRLANCGFQQIEQWFQCFNFASFIAIK